MPQAALAEFPGDVSSAFKSRGFFALLALVTALPIFCLPFHQMEVPSRWSNVLLMVWIVAGYGHVVSTVWFGIDRDYHPVIGANRARMLGSLAVLPLIMGAIALASAAMAGVVYAAYTLWLAHHYNRQNYGLLSFAAGHDRFGPLPREIGSFFHLTTAAGAIRMVAMPSIYPGMSPFSAPVFAYYAWYVAVILFAAATIVLVRLLLANRRLRQSPTTMLFLGLSYAFFLPSLYSGPSSVSFLPYAMAHGAQYLVMMGVTARQSGFGLLGLGLFAYIAIFLGFVAFNMTGIPWAQIYTGVVMWHFLVDARVWRLRDPAVRAIVKSRFGFVFS